MQHLQLAVAVRKLCLHHLQCHVGAVDWCHAVALSMTGLKSICVPPAMEVFIALISFVGDAVVLVLSVPSLIMTLVSEMDVSVCDMAYNYG